MSTDVQTPVRLPRINEPAPEFEAKSTHGVIKLSDYTSKGKWVLLFSHPADFTPVCTTEFVEFSRRFDEFEKRNVQLIGVSIDSIYSHIAWARNIEQNFNVQVKFPVIADLDQKVARSYGMVHEAVSDTAAVRAVFFIDPKGNVRALLYYPLSLGRNIEEILRVFDALQTAEANACATPANWKPGEAVIVPAPLTQADAATRVNSSNGYEVKDWYFSKKKLAEVKK
ncbi:MAG TPA: peroxiredoxin [Terriglobales bacterium]|jgi:peroxiredoxin (alkyl hydroperoxide reductase subunit C)|nr:peroxiredoxin [Terriglobales bacterium]